MRGTTIANWYGATLTWQVWGRTYGLLWTNCASCLDQDATTIVDSSQAKLARRGVRSPSHCLFPQDFVSFSLCLNVSCDVSAGRGAAIGRTGRGGLAPSLHQRMPGDVDFHSSGTSRHYILHLRSTWQTTLGLGVVKKKQSAFSVNQLPSAQLLLEACNRSAFVSQGNPDTS